MQVFSQDGKLISQFGEKRRIPVAYGDIPEHLIEALIATEDSRFYEHPGFDPIGIVRAASAIVMSGSASQGASTITQQLARNFFLSNEKKIMPPNQQSTTTTNMSHLDQHDKYHQGSISATTPDIGQVKIDPLRPQPPPRFVKALRKIQQ